MLILRGFSRKQPALSHWLAKARLFHLLLFSPDGMTWRQGRMPMGSARAEGGRAIGPSYSHLSALKKDNKPDGRVERRTLTKAEK